MVLAVVATVAVKAKEVSTVDAVTIALHIMVVVKIPISILLGTSLVEAFTNGVTLLLNIVGLLIEVTLDGEFSDVVSLSLAEGCVAFISSNVCGCVCDHCLYGDDCCHY